jgi:BirA family transcriptional regulator, biotin operon repressor / biotin---[acetyl-CoA-carboxylase] ligase
MTAVPRLLDRLRERCPRVTDVRHFPSLPSTNDHAKALARRDALAWTVVLADEQTAGRGRQGKAWTSPRGGLYLSLVLRPSPPADARWSLLPLAAGLAVVEALDEWSVRAALKWPNDVLLDGRKLGGILVEGASGPGGLESAVVGIGVNVGPPLALPDELRDQVAWLGESADAPELSALAATVLGRMAVWYDRLARENASVVLDAWRARSVPWWGRRVEARSGASTVAGVLRGLAPDGGLLIEGADGRETVLRSGEVREVRSPDPDPST